MQISTRCAKRNSKDSGELSISRVAMRKRLHTKTEVLVLQGTPPKSDVNHRKTAPWRDTGQGRQVEERTPHCASNCKARSSVDRKIEDNKIRLGVRRRRSRQADTGNEFGSHAHEGVSPAKRQKPKKPLPFRLRASLAAAHRANSLRRGWSRCVYNNEIGWPL